MQPNPTQPTSQQIHRIPRRDIAHYLIVPGTPLSKRRASVRLDVSCRPAREAFIKLAENGLTQIHPQCGSYVNKISVVQVRNDSFIHRAIECAMVCRAASVTTESQCYQLEQNLRQQRIAIERKQLDDFFELDDNLHRLLTQIANCQLVRDITENLKVAVDHVCCMSFSHVPPPEMLLRQHPDTSSALQKRDGDAVEHVITQHLQEISGSVCRIRQENSDWFNEEQFIPSYPIRGESLSLRLMAHTCTKKDMSLIKNKKYFTRWEYLYCAHYMGFDCKLERRKHL